MHKLFDQYASGLPRGTGFIEVGCANSPWLSYFAKRYGFRVAGVDYSTAGCERTEAILSREGTPGDVIHADLFTPPSGLLGRFDLALSQGVVEHFEDTTEPIRAIGALLRPGGTVVTIIPNLVGFLGPLQRLLNRPVYDVHVPLTADHLAHAHERAGLSVIAASYFIPLNFGVCNLAGLTGVRRVVWRLLIAALVRISYAVWYLDDRIRVPETRVFSGSVYCIARKE